MEVFMVKVVVVMKVVVIVKVVVEGMGRHAKFQLENGSLPSPRLLRTEARGWGYHHAPCR